jgi:AbrB family looped-hinge helix DNA binding protein
MRTTIDTAGRIVVPKAIRESLGLAGGQEVEVMARDGHLEIAVAPTTMRLQRNGSFLTAVPDRELPPLTAETVRETLEQSRR